MSMHNWVAKYLLKTCATLSYFILVFCLVFLTVAFLRVPMHFPCLFYRILVWHAAGWCPCGCCQPKRSSTLSHRRVFLDADAEGTRKAAEAIWRWQSEMPGVWPGGKRFLNSSDLFLFQDTSFFGIGKMGKFFKSFCPEMLQEVL